jgi:hypothetical protein
MEDSSGAGPGPVVHVTIGRIEVRAIRAEERAGREPAPALRTPEVSLEDYLRRRETGGGR